MKPLKLPVCIVALCLLGACGGGASASKGPVLLKGAGATAPYPIYSKWVSQFNEDQPGVKLEYHPTGSGDGIRQLEAGAVDFAASDIPLTDEELAKLPGKPLHFPTFTSAIVPIYNLPDVTAKLQFTGETLAGIFLGRIRTWNDPAITAVNKGVALPAKPIAVVYRSDASGSTHTLTEYLSEVSPQWKVGPGIASAIDWKTGEGAKGSEELTRKVKETPYSLGYVELNYAIRNKLSYGAVRNAKGKFHAPDFVAQNASVRAKPDLLKDFRVSVINADADEAYPLTTVTYLLIPSEIADKSKVAAMKKFLRWAYSSGMKLGLDFDYGILPPELVASVNAQAEKIH